MTDEAVITYEDEDTGTVFKWHGGAYIEVGYNEGPVQSGENFTANDVINVWDDEADKSYFETQVAGMGRYGTKYASKRPFRSILEMFEAQCREYLAESLADAE